MNGRERAFVRENKKCSRKKQKEDKKTKKRVSSTKRTKKEQTGLEKGRTNALVVIYGRITA